MNRFLRRVILVISVLALTAEILFILKWYYTHPLGKIHKNNLKNQIELHTTDLKWLINYQILLNKKIYTWNNSKILHENSARNNLGYCYPNEFVFVFQNV